MAKTLCGYNNLPTISGADLLAAYGPTLAVNLGFDAAWRLTSGAPPVGGLQGVRALVDSGASESCIDTVAATALKLPIVDRRPIAGVGGQHVANIYLAQIHIPTLAYTIFGAFAGVNLVAGGQSHMALIGRSFLRHFTMVYEGRTGTVELHNE